MKEMSHIQSVTFPRMRQRHQKIGVVPILRDLAGPVCVYCGNLRYFLVFRVSRDGRNGILVGRCRRCYNARGLTASDIEDGCHA